MSETNLSRRNFFKGLGGGAALLPTLAGCGQQALSSDTQNSEFESRSFIPVVTPGVTTMPFEMDGDVKVFRLTADQVSAPFPDLSDPHGMRRKQINCWGYNSSMIGPTIEVVEGDTVRIHFTNNLPDPTTVHWHGIELPFIMDGAAGFSQPPVKPGESYTYEFTLKQHGTFFYHSGFMQSKQVGLGLGGFLIVHPKNPAAEMVVDRDYCFLLQTWMINPGSPHPDTLEMSKFNFFTFNGRPAPDIPHIHGRLGEKIRVRLVNLSMLAHPIHLHGHTFRVTDMGGGFLPPHQQYKANTVNVSSGEARAFIVDDLYPGKWMFHCHFLHHIMNDMDRRPIPGQPAHAGHGMGGMHTVLEVE